MLEVYTLAILVQPVIDPYMDEAMQLPHIYASMLRNQLCSNGHAPPTFYSFFSAAVWLHTNAHGHINLVYSALRFHDT